MRIERNIENSKKSALIALILLIALTVCLVYNLNKNKEVKYETTKCYYETSDDGELTANITVKSQKDKLTNVSFEYLYVYEDDILFSTKFETEKKNVDVIKKLDGINTSITYDPNALLFEIKGTIDYTKLKDQDVDVDNYKIYLEKKLTKTKLIDSLRKQGYTCE